MQSVMITPTATEPSFMEEDINLDLLTKSPDLYTWIDTSRLNDRVYQEALFKLKNMSKGGFEHGDMSGLYTHFQQDKRYASTRFMGWHSIFKHMFDHGHTLSHTQTPLIFDFLAGAGTLSKRLRQLSIGEPLPVIGLDVSERMCKHGIEAGANVFWGSANANLFKNSIADVAVAAYGFHHVPETERIDFVKGMQRVLKEDGLCILHDFEEGSHTARFYSELIHKYRPYGHPYKHFSRDSLSHLLNQIFSNAETQLVYDPFYLEGHPGQDAESLKREFFSYIIAFFNLKEILPKGVQYLELFNYTNATYWRETEDIISEFFKLSDAEFKEITSHRGETMTIKSLHPISVEYVKEISILPLVNDRISLIAPRAALIGFAHNKRFI